MLTSIASRILIGLFGIAMLALGGFIVFNLVESLLNYNYAVTETIVVSAIFLVIDLFFGISMIYAAVTEGGPFIKFVDAVGDLFDNEF